MRLRKPLPLAAFAVLIMTAGSAMADIVLTATERENRKLVDVNITTNTVTPFFTTPDFPDSLEQLVGASGTGAVLFAYTEEVASQVRCVGHDGAGDILLAGPAQTINGPQDLILSPDGSFLLVANFSGNSITKINLAPGSNPCAAGSFPNGTKFTNIPTPEGIVYDGAGNLYVLAGFNTANAGIYQLNPTTGAIIRSNVGFDPANQLDGLTYDPSTNRLFATSSGVGGSNSIFSIDPATLAAVKIATVPAPDGVINNFHGLLYVASRTGFVYSVNESTFAVTQLTPVPTLDDLGIIPAPPPNGTKSFNPKTGNTGFTSTMTIAISNASSSITALGVAFTDTLPAGVVVATPPAAANNGCGGTLTAVAGSSSVSLSGGTLVGGASCNVQVNVVDNNVAGTMSQNCVTVSSTNGGSSPQTCDTLTVNQVVTQGLAVTKTFGTPPSAIATTVPLNGTTNMTITINNTGTVTDSGITLTDALPAGLVVATPNALANTCSGTATATAGSGTVSLASSTLAAGGSCTISLNVTATTVAAAISGSGCPASPPVPAMDQKINCVTVNSTDPVLTAAAIAILTVIPPLSPPEVAKSFATASIPIGGTTTLSFLVTNPNPTTALTNVSVTDVLPPGLIVATPPNISPTTCAGTGTITAAAGSNTISLSGATLVGAGSCTFSVDVIGNLAGNPVTNTSLNVTAGTCPSPIPVPPPQGCLVGNVAVAVLGINPPPDAYQIQYIPNTNIGGTVDITNAGELGADPFGPASGTTGNICANVYVFSPDQQEIECCSCLVTPNDLVHLSAADLVSNTASGVAPITNSIVVKLLATIPGTGASPGTQSTGPFTGTKCNAAFPFGIGNLAPGMRAWATKLHALGSSPATYGLTEGRFLTNPIDLTSINAATLQEITSITNRCRFIVGNQSGAGICKSCTLGGLGGAKK